MGPVTAEDLRLHCGRNVLNLRYPVIMGIVNLTDDSFSGGDTQRAIEQGLLMVETGAACTRKACSSAGCPSRWIMAKTEVMQSALAAGTGMINDINALQAPQRPPELPASGKGRLSLSD